jgi:hypothetical protein
MLVKVVAFLPSLETLSLKETTQPKDSPFMITTDHLDSLHPVLPGVLTRFNMPKLRHLTLISENAGDKSVDRSFVNMAQSRWIPGSEDSFACIQSIKFSISMRTFDQTALPSLKILQGAGLLITLSDKDGLIL